jgi:hypothetical protein
MKKSNYLTGLMAALIVVTISSASVFAAAKPEPSEERIAQMEEMRAEKEAHRAEMDALLDAGDYDAWAEYVTEGERGGKILEVINEDNFDEFVEAHELMEIGRGYMEDAKELFEELGLEKGQNGPGHFGKNMKHGKGFGPK